MVVREERCEEREIECVEVGVVCCSFVVGEKRFGCLVVGGDWLVEQLYCMYIE